MTEKTAFELKAVRTDNIKVELDAEFFNEEWFKAFRSFMYDIYTLEELAQHIAYNVVGNGATFIEGVGNTLRNGERPYWIKEDEEVNEHVNVIYYNTAGNLV